MSVPCTWYYRPTNSAFYPRAPLPGMATPTFVTDVRRGSPDHHTKSATTPRALGTPRDGTRPTRTAHAMPVSNTRDSYQEYLARIGRPTVASGYRFQNPALSFSYTNRTQTFDKKYIWQKMTFLEDSYRCLWSRHGGVKEGTKLGFKGK